MTGAAENETGFHGLREALGLNGVSILAQQRTAARMTDLHGDFLLIFAREVDELIVLGSHKEWDGRFVEASALAVPFLDRVKSALASQVEHEQDRDSIIANKGKHVDEFTLTTEIPDRECNLCVAD